MKIMDDPVVQFLGEWKGEVRYGPKKVVGEAFAISDGVWIPFQALCAFMGLDGLVHVGYANGMGGPDEDDCYWLEVWLGGDLIQKVILPAMFVLHYAVDVSPEAGRLVGRTFSSWAEFDKESGLLGAPVDTSGAGE